MGTDREKSAQRGTSSPHSIVTDSLVLDDTFVSRALGRDPVDRPVLDCARGIVNGVLIGSALWAAGLLVLAIVLG